MEGIQNVNTHGAGLSPEEQDKLLAAQIAEEEKAKADKAAKEVDDKPKETPAEILAKAAKLFKNYPAANVLHFTADGTAFFEAADAKPHAAKQKDTTVYPVKRKK